MATYREINNIFESKFDRVLVLGGTGFLGTHFVKHLQNMDVKLRIPFRNVVSNDSLHKEVDYRSFDTSQDIVEIAENFHPDLIVNLATYFTRNESQLDTLKLLESNVELVGLISEYSWRNQVRFLQAQSAWQSADGTERNMPTPYFLYKQMAQDIVDWYARNRGLQAVFLRFFDTYGENDNRDKLIPSLVSSLNSKLTIDASGGDQILDLVEANDAVHCLLAAANQIDSRFESQTYWCLPETPITIREFVAKLERISGLTVPINWGALPYRPGEIFSRWNISMEKPPGWVARTSIEEGIKKIVRSHG
jgi:nucleoside-diphosphate-sugar epimerase